VAAMLKHFCSHKVPSTTQVSSSFPVPPTMQAIVVDRVTIVDPQLASIVRNNAVIIPTSPEDAHATCPTRSEMITACET
jgi:hypothetical protein